MKNQTSKKFDRREFLKTLGTCAAAILPGTYIRKGDWKLIRFYGEGPNSSNSFELYNLKNDISETKNLAKKMPKKVKLLDDLITKHLKEIKALLPIKNPNYNPKSFNRPKNVTEIYNIFQKQKKTDFLAIQKVK